MVVATRRWRRAALRILSQIQIHQYNDSEILEFFNTHRVDYDLIGDHLFIIHSRSGDLGAGLGDWLVAGPDNEVDVERGDYLLRAQEGIRVAKAHRARTRVVARPLLPRPRSATPRRNHVSRRALARTRQAS